MKHPQKHYNNSLNRGKHQIVSAKWIDVNTWEPICCLTANFFGIIHALNFQADKPVNTKHVLPARGAEMINAFNHAGLGIPQTATARLPDVILLEIERQ